MLAINKGRRSSVSSDVKPNCNYHILEWFRLGRAKKVSIPPLCEGPSPCLVELERNDSEEQAPLTVAAAVIPESRTGPLGLF